MKIPFIDLKPVTSLVQAQVLGAWQHAVETAEFVNGPNVTALEKELAEALDTKHAVSCSNGTDAIVLALQAMGIGMGDNVAVPTLTFWATYEAVVQLGAIPILVDIDPTDLQMDFEELRRVSKEHHLRAVVLVHLMGWASPRLAEFRRVCEDLGVGLLEDGAQSFGTRINGHSVYEGAKVSTLSFYPAKVLGGCMDGGAVLTDDEELAALVRKLANHGRTAHYAYSHVGWNSRMGGLQAMWLRALMPHTHAIVAQRRRLVDCYREHLEPLRNQVQMRCAPNAITGNGYLLVCELPDHDPDRVGAALSARGIGTGRVYPETLDQQPPAKGAFRVSDLACAREFCRHVLNLPLYFGMDEDEVKDVCTALAEVLRKGA